MKTLDMKGFSAHSLFNHCYQCYQLNVERANWIDVFGRFFNLAFSGICQRIIDEFPANDRSREQIDRQWLSSSNAGLLYTSHCV